MIHKNYNSLVIEKEYGKKKEETSAMDYKKAGVDIEAGYKAVELMKEHIASTMRPEVVTDIGGFSCAFSMKSFVGME